MMKAPVSGLAADCALEGVPGAFSAGAALGAAAGAPASAPLATLGALEPAGPVAVEDSTGGAADGVRAGEMSFAEFAGGGVTGTTFELKAPESGDGIVILTFWLSGLGSLSSTIGSTTAATIASAIAPIRRRRARLRSCNSSSEIDFAI